jgi:putative glycosyltransferase
MKLSVVTSLYRSERFVREFHQRMNQACLALTDDYEIIMVNDGSPDGSLEIALDLQRSDSHLRVLDLSRNFGHHQAVSAGLSLARGERIFVIDVDLEEHPEWLARFWQEIDRADLDVVYGVSESRAGGLASDLGGRFFYWLFNLIYDTPIPKNACTVRLMTREYLEALLQLRDQALFLAGNYCWAGFRQKPITVVKERRQGRTSYGLIRRFSLFVTAITSFSAYPLKLIFFIGLIIALCGGVGGMVLIIRKLIFPESVLMGYSSIVVSIWFIGGIIIAFIGVLGVYLSVAFVEVKDRPRFLVRRVFEPSGADQIEERADHG